MTTIKGLHLLISTFVNFCNKEVRTAGDKVHLRLFLPPYAFHELMADFEASPLVQDKPEFRLSEDSNFETSYQYINVQVDIEEGKTFKMELIEGEQAVEKAMVEGGGLIPGRSPFTD